MTMPMDPYFTSSHRPFMPKTDEERVAWESFQQLDDCKRAEQYGVLRNRVNAHETLSRAEWVVYMMERRRRVNGYRPSKYPMPSQHGQKEAA